MQWLHRHKEYKPELLTQLEARAAIEETNRILSQPLSDISISQEIPPELTAQLEKDFFIFSGFKTHHELREASKLLKDDNGNFKPFQRFLKDVETLDNTYNRHYLRAEYNYATASVQMAVKWKEWEQDGDAYNLQYRTAGDHRVRREHAALHGVTLPPSDPFWDNFLPPNGWNCRCTTVQVRKEKYKVSDSKKAIEAGNACTAKPKQQIFRFNPGKVGKVFPPKHPYLPKGCGNCEFKQLSYDPNNETCIACKAIGRCLDRFGNINQIRERRKVIRLEAKRFLGMPLKNDGFIHEVFLSNRNLKELLNQPHTHYNEKNEAILSLDVLFKDSTYIGKMIKEIPTNHFDSYLFATKIANEKSWIIVRKYDKTNEFLIYSISDHPSITSHILKETY